MKMDDEYENKHYEKAFGNCLIVWKIEDFCLVACKENYCIHSSEFSVRGPETTKWRLTVTAKPSEPSCVLLLLRRMNDFAPIAVFANWSVTVQTLNEECFYAEFKHEFRNQTEKRSEICNLSDLLALFKPFSSDTLFIRCQLITQDRYIVNQEDKPVPSGLKRLSLDLELLYKFDKDKDMTIQIGKGHILAHKAVLLRCAALERIISATSSNVIELSHLNITALTRYIEFLYTGELNKVLQNPSIPMYKCLVAMDRELIKCHFASEELHLHTKISTDELEHFWIINNFSDRKKSVTSPKFEKINSGIAWQLRLRPSDSDNVDYLSIHADVVEGTKPSHACLEFAVEDDKRETYYPRRILVSNSSCDFGLKEFVQYDCLDKTSLLMADTLKLFFRVRTWDGSHLSKTAFRMMTFVHKSDESSYDRLSKSLLRLLENGTGSDVYVQAGDKIFKAHKCILGARSPVFNRITKDRREMKTLRLKEVDPCILLTFLRYIYGGVLLESEREKLEMLSKAAETYRIRTLAEECQRALQTLSTVDESSTLPEEPEVMKENSLSCGSEA